MLVINIRIPKSYFTSNSRLTNQVDIRTNKGALEQTHIRTILRTISLDDPFFLLWRYDQR